MRLSDALGLGVKGGETMRLSDALGFRFFFFFFGGGGKNEGSDVLGALGSKSRL